MSAMAVNPENRHFWSQLNLSDLVILGYGLLFFIWLKFVAIWRIPRLWALLDGIESPENMNRCMANNYSFEGFWRSWHRGFNQWLIRYIFIPLGGSKYKHINIWAVFTWVAIWHDRNKNLVLWAWGICLAFIPELLIKSYFNRPKFDKLRQQVWWKYVKAIGTCINISLLMVTNLIGFGVGYDLLAVVIEKLLSFQGFLVLILWFINFMMLSVYMFYHREQEEAKEGAAKGF
eukprot:TRINITY_DN10817_c0_g1_i4.p1 TRINITY_DN10817_c0_g1~~TRINITY_DN10817_c0_g1_i4.p1  ORF type:complete len:232 (+),score=39.98 TRINITY_DN10817_c0_g1_i4:152-847(+)